MLEGTLEGERKLNWMLIYCDLLLASPPPPPLAPVGCTGEGGFGLGVIAKIFTQRSADELLEQHGLDVYGS